MKSLAVTWAGFVPRTTTFTVSGTVSRTSFVIQELKIAVVPTPNATHPTAPACGVWESLPMMTMPGSACPSRILEWQMASDPWWPRRSSPYSRIPCFSALARRDADLSLGRIRCPVAGDDLLAERHRARRGVGWGERHLSLESCDVEVEQPSVLDDPARDLAFARGERAEGDGHAASHL